MERYDDGGAACTLTFRGQPSKDCLKRTDLSPNSILPCTAAAHSPVIRYSISIFQRLVNSEDSRFPPIVSNEEPCCIISYHCTVPRCVSSQFHSVQSQEPRGDPTFCRNIYGSANVPLHFTALQLPTRPTCEKSPKERDILVYEKTI